MGIGLKGEGDFLLASACCECIIALQHLLEDGRGACVDYIACLIVEILLTLSIIYDASVSSHCSAVFRGLHHLLYVMGLVM